MKFFFGLLLVVLFLLIACKGEVSHRSEISFTHLDSAVIKNKSLIDWHHLDIENDTIPGISWDRLTQKFDINLTASTIIALLDTPLEIENKTINKYLWHNYKETIDGLDNDRNGYIDDIYGWNFLGDTLGSTVLFNNFEYTRIIKKTIDYQNIEDDSLFKRAQKKYNSKFKFSQSIVSQIPALLQAYRKQLSHSALPKNEQEITTTILDSLVDNNSILEEEITLIRRALQFELTTDVLTKDSLNYTRHLDYYLNQDYNDRTGIANYKKDVNHLYYGTNAINTNSEELNHSIKTSGVIALALENIPESSSHFKIMPVAISNYGDEHDFDIIAGIKYAVDNGAKIINMSSGKSFSMFPKEVLEAIRYAQEKGVLFVTSAGNDNLNLDMDLNTDYPNDTDFTSLDEIVSNFIKVGNSNHNLKQLKSPNSNYGKEQVDLFAPGNDITTLYKEQVAGTSYAAPQVSLIASLLFSQYPSLTASEVKKILMDSSVKYDILVDVPTKENPEQQLPFSELSKSGGIVNAYNAMLMAEEYVKNGK